MKTCSKCRVQKEDGAFPIGRRQCDRCTAQQKNKFLAETKDGWTETRISTSVYGPCSSTGIPSRRARARDPRKGFEYALASHWGLSFEMFSIALIAQGGRCSICSRPMTGTNEPAVDHSHATGALRDLLCSGCNIKLGAIESPLYPALLAYLEYHKNPDNTEPSSPEALPHREQNAPTIAPAIAISERGH